MSAKSSARDALEGALGVYGSLTRSLLEKLNEAEAAKARDGGVTAEVRDLIRDVQKSLIVVIEAENRLMSKDEKLAAAREAGLDLDAARDEVRRRLARLRAD